MAYFRNVAATILAVLVLFVTGAARADDAGTADQAKAMVEKAASFLAANGREKALAEFSNPKGQFIDRDLYIVTYSPEGIRLSHPYNAKLVGTSVLDAVDFDGKAYGKDIIDTANKAGSGWVDYKYSDPATKKLSQKSLFVKKAGDIIIGCGIYKH